MNWSEAYAALVDVQSFVRHEAQKAKEGGLAVSSAELGWMVDTLEAPIQTARHLAHKSIGGENDALADDYTVPRV